MNGGTPKTLKEAIENGLKEAIENGRKNPTGLFDANCSIEAHVIDFLAQRFGVAMLNSESDEYVETALANLYQSITGRKIK